MIRRTFLITLSFFLILWGFASSNEDKIRELEKMKKGYEARALKLEDQASYQQFDQETYLETRRIWKLAEENRRKAALIQQQIDELKKQNE